MSEVWLGDLIQAWQALSADGERSRQVAALMGFGLPTAVRPAPARAQARAAFPPQRPDPAEPVRGTERGPVSGTSASAPASAQRGTPAAARQVTFQRNLRPAGVDVGLRTTGEDPVRAGSTPGAAAGLLPPEPAGRPVPPPLLPLLPARVTPGIVAGAVATDAGDGALDVDALTELVARRHFDQPIPRVVRASLFRSVQLLLDRSPAMAPFARDVTEVARLVRSVVGHDVETVSFSGRPQDRLPRGGNRYVPPRPGTPVLAFTDLGIGQPPGYLRPDAREAWPPLAEALLRRGSELVAFVPYPRSRWPALDGLVRMIPWDTTTSPADVTRAVGRILGGPRGRS